MADLEYQVKMMNLLVNELDQYSGDFVKSIELCREYLDHFPSNGGVCYTEADFLCQLGLGKEGEEKVKLLQECAQKLEAICNDADVGNSAKEYLSKVRLIIGECFTDLSQRIDIYERVDDPAAKLLCAYLQVESNKDFEKAKKCIDEYVGEKTLDDFFSISEVMVKYNAVQMDFSVLPTVTWKDSSDYKKNMALFGLLLKDDGFTKLKDEHKDLFLSSLHSVYTNLPIKFDEQSSEITEQDKNIGLDKNILKKVLVTLFEERAREIKEDTVENIVQKAQMYSTLLTIDSRHLESYIYLGDKAISELNWTNILSNYIKVYDLTTSPRSVLYNEGRMPWMIYAVFKTGRSFTNEKYDLIKKESNGTSEELLCDLLLQIHSTRKQDVDLRTDRKREFYFGFDALRTFTELSLGDPENKLYAELVKDLVVLSKKKPISTKKRWKLW